MKLKDLESGFHYGMHANGQIYGHRVTNSKEAFLYWYKRGQRFFEMDVAASLEGTYVSIAHELTEQYLTKYQIIGKIEEKSSAFYLKQKTFSYTTKGLTPMSLSDILALMLQYNDIIIMLDPCLMPDYDFKKLVSILSSFSKQNRIEDRLLLEIYDMNMYEIAKDTGINVILCVHDSRYPQIIFSSAKVLTEKGIKYVSYPWVFAKNEKEAVKKISDEGLIVLSVHKDNLCHKEMQELGIKINLVSHYYSSLLNAIFMFPVNLIRRRINIMYFKLKTGRECY